jgi:two-component sensor histidine kinase
VADSTRKGLGSRLIASSLQAYGQATIRYEPAGVVVTTEMPLSKIEFRNDLAQIDT